MRRIFHLDFLMFTAVFAAIVIYGSLVPFDFHWRPGAPGPVRALLETWDSSPKPSDFLANVLLYAPFGFLACRSVRSERLCVWCIAPVMFAGGVLSIAIELAQYFDAGRFSSAMDVYANVAGTIAGAVAGLFLNPDFPWPFIGRIAGKPFPSLILAAWLVNRLYPFVPTTNFHKYWNAIRPVVLAPSVTAFDFFRHSVAWLVVYALLDAIGARSLPLLVFALFALGVLAAKILVIGRVLSMAEILGAGAAYAIWLVLFNRPERIRTAIVAVLVGAYVLIWRLEPFQFTEPARQFGWIPFSSVIRGSVTAHILDLSEKAFYYGALLWLLTAMGVRLWSGAIALALLLLATSLAEMYLPGHSAESTDAAIVLVLAVAATLMRQTEVPRAGSPSDG